MTDTDATVSPEMQAGIWHLDDAVLDETSRRLTRGEAVQALDRSAFDVLRYLLLNAGEVCTQDELLHAGWPGRVVTANSLVKCIGRLRQALGDAEGKTISVVQGYGYRLTAQVCFIPSAEPRLVVQSAAVPREGEEIPHRPGWRVTGRLGRGGSGDVLRAEAANAAARAYKFSRDDSGFRALKREVALHRLLEARHAHLRAADPLVDWNLTTPPFFIATELHPAGNLADWAARDARLASLDEAQRVALAVALCRAVADLHEADIAHRDLKPENLYVVSEAPEPWRVVLGDLGVGLGLLPPGVDEIGVPIGQLTRHGAAPGTGGSSGRYIAPEVLAGHPATAKSDLYALGVLIFQIVVGDLQRPLAPGWQEDIADPLLREDIALAAHLHPAQRIASARLLEQRLSRLDARRSDAQAEARRAREHADALRRLAEQRQRRRLYLGVSVALLLGVFVASWMAWRAVEARAASERHAEEARAVRDFLTDSLLAQANPYTSNHREIRLKDALDVSARAVADRFKGSPGTAAAIALTLSDVYQGWADYEPALHHHQQGIAALRQAEGEHHPEVARVLTELCLLARRAGEVATATDACREAAMIEQSVFGEVRPATIVARAKLDFDAGRCKDTLPALDSVIATVRNQPGRVAEVADAYWFRGLCLAEVAEFDRSRQDFERLLVLKRARYGDDHPDVGWAHMDFAETQIIAGNFQIAAPQLERAMAIFTQRFGPDHADTQVGHYEQARILHWGGDAAAAVPLFERVVDHWRQSLGEDHLWTLYAQAELGWALADAGRLDAAGVWLQRSREIAARRLINNPASRTFFREAWVRTLLRLGEVAAARDELDALKADLELWNLPTHPRHALALCLEAELLAHAGNHAEAMGAHARCTTGLADLPAENYRRRWAAETARRLAN